MPLTDQQARMTAAMLEGTPSACADLLVGGGRPDLRFAVHVRHYHASLTRALVERFPATCWLTGSDLVSGTAAEFVREHPPSAPCLAEYGETFPAFLGGTAAGRHLPYIEQFATIDWHLGALAIATNAPPVVMDLDWSLDELFAFFLSGEAPDQYVLRTEPVRLELSGSRGELSLQRRRKD